MCGLPRAGKTARAKQLEEQLSVLRLTPDEWISHLYGADVCGDALDAARDPVESVLWELASRVLTLGVDVILDFGFWSREARDMFRDRAARLGAGSRVHFVDAPENELLRRLAARNAALPANTFWIDESRMREWMVIFERPTGDELQPRNPA
jgi:predicted kinase